MTYPSIRTAAIALLVLGITGCDLFGPDVGPPAELAGEGLPGNLVAGQTVEVFVTVTDAEGQPVQGATVTWTPSEGGSIEFGDTPTAADGATNAQWTLATTTGIQTLVAAVGNLATTFIADVGPDELAGFDLDPAETTLVSIGDTLAITAMGRDQYGNEAPASGVNWSSSAPAVASVDGAGLQGVVVSQAEGTATITAALGSVAGTATVAVDQVVTGIGLDPGQPVMVVGESLNVTAGPVDARGATVDTTLDVTWSSSDPSVATVSEAGVVDAVGTGTAVVSAVAGELTGSADIDVREGPRPFITGITPAVLAADDTATITGTGFSADPAQLGVTIGGVAATVLTAAETELTVVVPAGETQCAPPGDRDVVVAVDGLEASQSHPVAGAPQHAMAVGGSVALFGADVSCNELTEPGTYVISVFNATTSPLSATSFRLRGTGSAAAALGHGATPVRSPIRVTTERATMAPDPELDGHLRMLEENIRLVERLGPRPPTGSARRALAAEEVGDIRSFRIPDIEADNRCTNYIEVTARAVFVGTYGVIWEDTLAPLAGSMDAEWEEVGAEYDDVMHPILLEYFGDPLVFDSQLDDNGLFFMLFSKTVNDFQSPAVNGFVFAGDFYSRDDCASSDLSEIFYGRVPTTAPDPSLEYDYSAGTPDNWAWGMRATVIHEVKHLTAYANKFDVNAAQPNLEESGLEEATARLAEEFYGRALQGYTQGDNVGYDASIWCERRVGANYPDCELVPLIMGKHYGGVNTYLKTPSLLSPFGRVDSFDSSFYGSGWQWVRWAIDQSGQAEADFIKPLVREGSLTGPANLADKAGRTVPELLADYTLAFAVDDHPSGASPARSELTMPGWDTRDIFQGLHDDYAGTSFGAEYYPTPWPLEPVAVSGGDFQVDVPTIQGGAAAIIELSGMSGAQLLELLSGSGGTAPASLGLAIMRVQ